MKRAVLFVLLLPACATTLPPGTTGRGPQGTFAYPVLLESSVPGARIEVNQERDDDGTPPFRLTFPRSSSSAYREAVRLAKQSPGYTETQDGPPARPRGPLRHEPR